MSSIATNEKIPNNVDLASDKRLQRALEEWQPNFIKWWNEMGPEGFQQHDVWLRTAISVDSDGWANFDYVKMPDYRWGIFLADPVKDRTIGFGDEIGKPVWQEVPGEHRNALRRLIVTQGDTEPASVEQQRLLGQTVPEPLRPAQPLPGERRGRPSPLGDGLPAPLALRSRRPRGSRGPARAPQRQRGQAAHPRRLQRADARLALLLHVHHFTDRDGKYQLLALAESAFDPLSRTTRFMLTEEAHHMFVGETGVQRVVERTAELMRDQRTSSAFGGAIDLPTIQSYLNFWFSLSLDLFGGEISSNAASYFASGLKGRAHEDRYEDHVALEGGLDMLVPKDGVLVEDSIPMRNAMNEVLRDEYVDDCQRGVDKWNKTIAEFGVPFELTLPSSRFNRQVGLYAGLHFAPDGGALSADEWAAKSGDWLPSDADRAYLASIMSRPVLEPGKMAHWIAAPRKGIKGKPVEFEYVRHD